MKNMVHKGWLYVASMALALLGLVGVSYTASAQVLWVLGEKVSDPLNQDASKSQSGNNLDNTENWNGYWEWEHNTNTLLIKNINSNKPVQGIYAKDIPDFTIKVEGSCTFGTSEKNKSVVESDGCSIYIEGVGDNAELFIRTKRGSSHGIRIAKNRNLYVTNCLVDVSSENYGITGEGDGTGVGIRIGEGGRIEAKGATAAIKDIKDDITVFENGDWVSINSSIKYARVAISNDENVRYDGNSIVYEDSGNIVKGEWVMLAPYYPISVAGVKLHRYRWKLTPDRFPSIISAGSLEYDSKDHRITLTDATIVSDDYYAAIMSSHPSKFLLIGCKGANKITTSRGSAIRVLDKSSPTIYAVGDNASLELYPSTDDHFPGIWDETEESYLVVKDIDLKIRSKAACIYTKKDNKTVSLVNLSAMLTTTVPEWPLISGFKTLTIDGSYIASPLGAVVDEGTIKLNGTFLGNTTCEIKRGNAPTYNVTIDSGIKNGRIRVTNYSGSLSSVPLGTKLQVEATPDAGYHLTKILAGGENITSSKEFVVTRNAEISAQFDIDKYNVTSSSSSGGSISLSHSGSVAYGTEVTVTVNPDEGYELAKLTANGTDITATKKFVVKGATTVEATFVKDTAIEEVSASEVVLYPNPAVDVATLSGIEAGAMVQLFSLDGAEVLRTMANEAGVARLDLTGVAAGKYLVKSGETMVALLVTK
ncbi:InlB B-repeat-containing protein [Porphyromonas sp.]